VEAEGADDPELPDEIDLSGLRILVVDDNATNLKILCEMLTSWKMNAEAGGVGSCGFCPAGKSGKQWCRF
jgi:hypothetical protein